MMETMLIWRFLRRRWWLILLPALVVAVLVGPQLLSRGGASGGGFAVSFRYSAAQAASNLPQRDGDYQDVWLASEFTVNAFTEWVRSSSFREELVAALPALDLAPLGIAADKARSVGLVQMSHPDAAALEQIALAAVEVLKTRNAAYFPHLGGQNADVSLLDTPQVTPAPPPIANRFGPLLQIGAGLFVGLLLALGLEAVTPFVRARDELEAQGWQVLGSIPRE